MSGLPPSSKPDDSLDSFLANQQISANAAPDDPAMQQFQQYARANPLPRKTYAAGIGMGFIFLYLALKLISTLIKSGNL